MPDVYMSLAVPAMETIIERHRVVGAPLPPYTESECFDGKHVRSTATPDVVTHIEATDSNDAASPKLGSMA